MTVNYDPNGSGKYTGPDAASVNARAKQLLAQANAQHGKGYLSPQSALATAVSEYNTQNGNLQANEDNLSQSKAELKAKADAANSSFVKKLELGTVAAFALPLGAAALSGGLAAGGLGAANAGTAGALDLSGATAGGALDLSSAAGANALAASGGSFAAGAGGITAGSTALSSALSGAGAGALKGAGIGALQGYSQGGLSGALKGAALGGVTGGATGGIGGYAGAGGFGDTVQGLVGGGSGGSGGGSGGSSGILGSGISAGNALNAGINLYSGIEGVNTAQANAKAQQEANAKALALQGKIYNQTSANLSPYITAGEAANSKLSDLVGTSGNTGADGYGSLTAAFNPSDLENTPSYQFELQQGTQALNRSLGAQGNLFSGQALKAAQQFGQGLADTTYNTAFGQDLQQKQQTYNELSGVGNSGQSAATNLGNIGAGYAGTATTALENQGNITANSNNAQQSAINQGLAGALNGNYGFTGGGSSQYGNNYNYDPITGLPLKKNQTGSSYATA